MAEKTWFSVVMSSETEEERIRGIIYSKDPFRLGPLDDDAVLFRIGANLGVLLMCLMNISKQCDTVG